MSPCCSLFLPCLVFELSEFLVSVIGFGVFHSVFAP